MRSLNDDKKNTKNSNALIWLLILLGIALIAYPTVSNDWNQVHQSAAIAGYATEIEEISTIDTSHFWDEIHQYNNNLVHDEEVFYTTEKSHKRYMETLNVSPKTGVIAYLEVPVLDVKLAIYHTTDDVILQTGIGHLEGSSLPSNGEWVHTVLFGHSGLPSAKLLTDLNKMQPGDIFMVHVLDQVLTYEVSEILTVLPEEMEYLTLIDEGNYCSMVTCTPYGVNSHRLIVRGHLIPTPVSEPAAEAAVEFVDPNMIWKKLLYFVPRFFIYGGIVAFAILSIYCFRKTKRKE